MVCIAAASVIVLGHSGHRGAAGPHADPSITGTPITVGTDTCAPQWRGGPAGRLSFAVWNNSIQGLAVYLQSTTTAKLYLAVDNLGAGATRAVTADVPAGSYRFLCVPGEADPVRGAAHALTGATTRTAPGVRAVTDNDLTPALHRYLAWIRDRVPRLLTEVRALDRDVRRGDLAAARVMWLRAHVRYETLGAAYGVFGKDDTRIDARASTTVPARSDRHLHGFHRVEALLWSGATATTIAPETRRLVRSVEHLRSDLRTPVINPIDIGLRAHEILENALEFELSGRSDTGSHTELATLAANLVGTRHALAPIRHLLVGRDPDLHRTYAWLGRTQRYLRRLHRGGWPPLSGLTRRQRERLDADVSECVELLSRVAVITDPRRVGP